MGNRIVGVDGSISARGRSSVAHQNKPLDRIYDVFLSHRRQDEAVVAELNDYIENELHFEAYVDWKDSGADLDRQHVSEKTADYLRTIMRHACSLIFVVGKNPGESRWTPWELGFFDGRQSAQRIGVYVPDGIELPAGQEYLGLYGRQPLRKADLRGFLEKATLDVAAMDSAQSDQWTRHLHRAWTRPDDYWLSVLQWQFGFAANLMTAPDQKSLLPDEQPSDVPREPGALFGPWLQGLRQCQHAIAAVRRQLHAAHRERSAEAAPAFAVLQADWRRWLARATPFSTPLAEGFESMMEANNFNT
jgi:hypothetical protein